MTFVPVAGTVRSHPRPGSNSDGNIVSLALNAKRGKRDDGESETFVVAATLSSGGHPNSNMPGRRKEDDVNLVVDEPYTFDWQMGGSWSEGGQPSRSWIQDTPGHTLSLGRTKTLAVHEGATVRRLTPTECERLQALPDGWTNPNGDAPDSRRYAALGDAVTSSVGEWIGRRIIAEDAQATIGMVV